MKSTVITEEDLEKVSENTAYKEAKDELFSRFCKGEIDGDKYLFMCGLLAAQIIITDKLCPKPTPTKTAKSLSKEKPKKERNLKAIKTSKNSKN